MIDLVFNNSTSAKAPGKEFFKKIMEASSEVAGLASKKIELSVNLVEQSKIKSLNKRYRNKNTVTDVLSFPLNKEVGVRSAIGGIIALGDIFICLPIAKKNAAQEGVSFNSKLAFLSVHGFLHLLGYDHQKSGDKKEMFAMQKKILDKLSI